MILAPRSCPSRPGFATTTLIFPATVGQYRNVKLTVVGCSPAWPNPSGSHAGYLVESEGRRLLVDCGPGVLARLREREPWPRIDAIVISHFHLDHCGDLVPWLWGHLIGSAAGTPGPDLHVPPGGLARVTTFAPVEQFRQVFRIEEYEDAVPFTAAGHRVTPTRVAHSDEPTWGLRIEHGGRVLGYSADTGPTPALIEVARDADVFLCEATLIEPTGEPHGHLTPEEARSAAAAANARRLLITHRPAEHPLDELVYDGFELEV
jgi:ribonuclease BN (tRNA processing enzyme)